MARLLIVDDNEQNRYLLESLLKGRGYETVLAHDGAEALRLAAGEQPDLVISDILMPVMDGYTLCQRWKTDERLRSTPFVFYTATYTDPKDEELARSLGADRFLIKPMEPDRFVAEVEEVLGAFERGALAPPRAAEKTDDENLERYNAALIRKLDAKITQLNLAYKELEGANGRLGHVNQLLDGIRSVNQLIVREQDRIKLVTRACELLVKSRGYTAVWIAVAGAGDEPASLEIVQAGLDPGALSEAVARFGRGELPACCREARAQGEVIYTETGATDCEGCTLGCERSLTAHLRSRGRSYGFISAALPPTLEADEQDRSLFSEVAADVAFALYSLEESLHLAAEQEKYRTLVANTQGMVYRGRPDGTTEIVSGSAALCGYSAQELSAPETTWLSLIHPDDRARVETSSELLTRGPETQVRGYRIRTKGGEQRWVEDRLTSVFSSEGELRFVGGVVYDVTEQEALRQQVAQADRMASVGLLAAGVAHEINNPLTYVLYNIEYLAEDLPRLCEALSRLRSSLDAGRTGGQARAAAEITELCRLEELGRRAKEAAAGAERIRRIVDDLRTFSRVDDTRVVPVSLNQVIDSALNMVSNEIKYRARVVRDYGELPTVMANDGKLAQVFLNLLVNAAHAIEEGATEENQVTVATRFEEGELIAEVRDTGEGIRADHMSRLFEPFFTTKEAGVGSGLGLSIANNIIGALDGRIDVESEVGRGTRFLIRIPLNQPYNQATPAEAPASEDLPPEARGRVMVIDDEPLIAESLSRMLAREHEVVVANSGAEAIEILDQDRRFDMILCDLLMPRVTGMDLHAWLSQHYPTLMTRMVFMTGGAFTPKAKAFLTEVSNIRLEKPFSPRDLLAIAREKIRPRD